MRTLYASALLVACSLAAGCGLAAGPFGGKSPRVSGGGGYATATVGPSSASGQSKHVGAFICANCGYGLGLQPGYGHTSITRDGRPLETSGRTVRLFIEWLFRFHPAVNIGLESAFEGITAVDMFHEPDPVSGTERELQFIAFANTVNWNFLPSAGSRLWFGGGYTVNGVSGTSGNGFKGVVGAQTTLGSLIGFRIVLRIEGSYARGANDFEQKWVNGGFVFWMDPNWRP